MTKRTVKRLAFGIAVGTLAATAGMGVLHTSFARPLLAKLGGGCPIGKGTAAEIENARMVGVVATRGTERAPARPALGFTLDAASPEDVQGWASRHQLACTDTREGMYMTCRDVPLAALGRIGETGRVDEVGFAFRPRDRRLVNVTATSFGLSSEDAAARMNSTVARLGTALGAPAVAAGDATAANLGRGGYATATVEYRYSDFMAEVTATGLGSTRGVAVREHYISAID